jgi:hypothetical protein
MANEEHLAILRKGVEVWNAWRKEHSDIKPNLGEANLRGADLGRAYLADTDLRGAKLGRANLRRVKLGKADLVEANLRGANLVEANLRGADLGEANLGEANFQLANLIDSYLDRADLTDAKLWETQRGGWSIKGLVCRRAFWDRDGKEPTEYSEDEFERLFAEKPKIILRYPGGMSLVDLAMLPLIVERLQLQHPNSKLNIQSVQDDAGGAAVTITVEDLQDRDADPPSKQWTPLLSSMGGSLSAPLTSLRGIGRSPMVSDDEDATDLHGRVQARGGGHVGKQRPTADAGSGRARHPALDAAPLARGGARRRPPHAGWCGSLCLGDPAPAVTGRAGCRDRAPQTRARPHPPGT